MWHRNKSRDLNLTMYTSVKWKCANHVKSRHIPCTRVLYSEMTLKLTHYVSIKFPRKIDICVKFIAVFTNCVPLSTDEWILGIRTLSNLSKIITGVLVQ